MISPQELKVKLSSNINSLMNEVFPDAKRETAGKYTMGDLDGNPGRSTSVYLHNSQPVYIAKDNATGQCINILELLIRKRGTGYHDTVRWALRWLGISQSEIHPVKKASAIVEAKLETTALRGSETAKYMAGRGINERVCSKYGVAPYMQSGKEFWTAPFYDEEGRSRMFKCTNIERGSKKQIWTSKPTFWSLFGLDTIDDNKSILLTEGEIDAMSLDAIQSGMPETSEDTAIPALSVPCGVSNMDWIANNFQTLSGLETIFCCCDNDSAGDQLFLKLGERLGVDRVKRLSIPPEYNDVNQWHLDAKPTYQDLFALIHEAQGHTLSTLSKANEFGVQLTDEITRYEQERECRNFIWPVPLSLRPSELIIATGLSGHGKSQLCYEILLHQALEQNRKSLAISFEITIPNMLWNLAHIHAEEAPTYENQDEIIKDFDNIFFMDSSSFKSIKHNWEGVEENIRFAKQKWGVSFVLIDSFQYLAPKLDFDLQSLIVKSMQRLAVKEQMTILLIAHSDGKKMDQGGKYPPKSPSDILGSQDTGAAAHTIFSCWRNTQKGLIMSGDDEEQKKVWSKKCDGKFTVFKQRATGDNFEKDLWFDTKKRKFSLTPIITYEPTEGLY